ncbi:hypothetical protein JG687_00008567 [Phytophthora cactorum]|uniref:Uncharacterized protein n=1 Tax=Phytophthora cactorum TaxID=29920 RepID=A0A8T1UH67_9STRA|nr:hypothetical protein GQ600_17482 [Phytophthora cactorum]KAG6959823.1 hypothetical protein JG687_00008567 [Phytophthora cactorum]
MLMPVLHRESRVLRPQDPSRSDQAGGCFQPLQARIIGVSSVSNSRWTAFLLNRDTRPLLHIKDGLTFVPVKWCKQQDGNSGGVLCLAVVELLLTKKSWSDELYDLIPYLRLQYLNKSIALLDQATGERGVRP